MDTSKYKALYLQEVYEHLSGIENGLLVLEKEPGDAEAINNLFRHYHSIKGMSASMGYQPIQELAHAQETLLDGARAQRLKVTTALTSTLLECLDVMKSLVRMVEEDQPVTAEITPYLDKLTAAAAREQAPPAAKKTAPEETKAQAAAPELRLPGIMKVEGKVFDDLLTTVGGLFMSLSTLKSTSREIRSIPFKDNVYTLGKTIGRLHESILSARMLPLKDLTENLPRVVRDMSVKTGKEVNLTVDGAEMSLDRAVLENLGSPLVHAIRNAIDHGIELPDERKKRSKPPGGAITIKAFPKKDRVAIVVSDDGAGIDPDKVRAKAVQKGFPAEKARAMSDREAMMLVCMPGLSTAEKITETSGRGVGLDVVKSVIEGLGGTLEIESRPGYGTDIIMELPRTTSVVKALVVKVGPEQFLLPNSKIVKVIEVKESDVASGTFIYDGSGIQTLRLGAVLGMGDIPRGGKCTMVVVEASAPASGPDVTEKERLYGILVDDFEDEIDAYIKPLTPPLSRLWGVLGLAILGDGRPVFLVDLAQLISRAFSPAGKDN